MWQDLIAALCLVLVVEGILPFIKPDSWRRMMTVVAKQPDSALRTMGFVSMLVGVALLYVVR